MIKVQRATKEVRKTDKYRRRFLLIVGKRMLHIDFSELVVLTISCMKMCVWAEKHTKHTHDREWEKLSEAAESFR